MDRGESNGRRSSRLLFHSTLSPLCVHVKMSAHVLQQVVTAARASHHASTSDDVAGRSVHECQVEGRLTATSNTGHDGIVCEITRMISTASPSQHTSNPHYTIILPCTTVIHRRGCKEHQSIPARFLSSRYDSALKDIISYCTSSHHTVLDYSRLFSGFLYITSTPSTTSTSGSDNDAGHDTRLHCHLISSGLTFLLHPLHPAPTLTPDSGHLLRVLGTGLVAPRIGYMSECGASGDIRLINSISSEVNTSPGTIVGYWVYVTDRTRTALHLWASLHHYLLSNTAATLSNRSCGSPKSFLVADLSPCGGSGVDVDAESTTPSPATAPPAAGVYYKCSVHGSPNKRWPFLLYTATNHIPLTVPTNSNNHHQQYYSLYLVPTSSASKLKVFTSALSAVRTDCGGVVNLKPSLGNDGGSCSSRPSRPSPAAADHDITSSSSVEVPRQCVTLTVPAPAGTHCTLDLGTPVKPSPVRLELDRPRTTSGRCSRLQGGGAGTGGKRTVKFNTRDSKPHDTRYAACNSGQKVMSGGGSESAAATDARSAAGGKRVGGMTDRVFRILECQEGQIEALARCVQHGKVSHHRSNTASHHGHMALHRDNTSSHHGNTSPHHDNTSPYRDNKSSHRGKTSPHRDSTASHHGNTSAHHDNTSPHRDNTSSHRGHTSAHRGHTSSHHDNTSAHHDNTSPHHDNTSGHYDNTSAVHCGEDAGNTSSRDSDSVEIVRMAQPCHESPRAGLQHDVMSPPIHHRQHPNTERLQRLSDVNDVTHSDGIYLSCGLLPPRSSINIQSFSTSNNNSYISNYTHDISIDTLHLVDKYHVDVRAAAASSQHMVYSCYSSPATNRFLSKYHL